MAINKFVKTKKPYIPESNRAASFEEIQKELLQYRAQNIIGLQEGIIACALAHGIEVHQPGAKQLFSNIALAACQHFEQENLRKADQSHNSK